MKRMNKYTLHICLIIFILTILLAIIIYMTGAEVDMVEKCREPLTASTKICNGVYP
jgi:hypothetical protein